MFLSGILVIHVCDINAGFMMPHSAANALNPSWMCSVVTVLPFAQQAANFVVFIGPTVRLRGLFRGAFYLWRRNLI